MITDQLPGFSSEDIPKLLSRNNLGSSSLKMNTPAPTEQNTINYKYNEGKLIEDFTNYVNATYGQHYSLNRFQATEFIIDNGHGVGFCAGNVMKYVQRYGKKAGRNRQDLMKVLHYALMLLYVHDYEEAERQGKEPVMYHPV